MEKFRNYVGLVLCLCIVTTVSTAQRKVETVAEKVMLFIDGAQVTRTKRVDIPAGNSGYRGIRGKDYQRYVRGRAEI